MILNDLNKSAMYKDFKMDTLQSAINLIMMTPNCYTSTLDRKDAYLPMPVGHSPI